MAHPEPRNRLQNAAAPAPYPPTTPEISRGSWKKKVGVKSRDADSRPVLSASADRFVAHKCTRSHPSRTSPPRHCARQYAVK